MAQNKLKKEIKQMESEIDYQLLKISRLLSLLPLCQTKLVINTYNSIHIERESNKLDSDKDESRLNITNEQSDCFISTGAFVYDFEAIFQNQDEQILLDDYLHYKNEYVEELHLIEPISITISPKHNWISNYLDHKDANIYVQMANQRFLVESVNSGVFSCVRSSNQQKMIIQSEKIYKVPQIQVSFYRHLNGYLLNSTVNQKKYIYSLTLQKTSRILVQLQINKSLDIERLIIIKQTQQNNKYEVIWGNYSCQEFIESLILQPGHYILLSLSSKPDTNIAVYLQNRSDVLIKMEEQNSYKTYNLLKQSFSQCDRSLKRALSFAPGQQSLRRQFVRSCYMDLGIIIEIYQNIYENEAAFLDKQSNLQDISLLFPEIYSSQQLTNKLTPGERITKFYAITQKPARLFVPKKKVLTAGLQMDNITIHTIFK